MRDDTLKAGAGNPEQATSPPIVPGTDTGEADAAQRRAWLAQACGMWRDRDDLPDLALLRREFERFPTK